MSRPERAILLLCAVALTAAAVVRLRYVVTGPRVVDLWRQIACELGECQPLDRSVDYSDLTKP